MSEVYLLVTVVTDEGSTVADTEAFSCMEKAVAAWTAKADELEAAAIENGYEIERDDSARSYCDYEEGNACMSSASCYIEKKEVK